MVNTENIGTVLIKRENSLGYIFISGVIYPNKEAAKNEYEKTVAISDILSALDIFEKDESVQKVAMIINSEGGSVEGLTNLNDRIKNFSKEIIVYVNSNCLSAAYWIASAAKKIVALSKTAFFGSIGVISPFDSNLKEQYVSNTGSPNKIPDEISIQKELDSVFEVFVKTVAENRKKTVDYVKEYFGRGSAVSAEEALKVGLIDEIDESSEIISAFYAVLAKGKCLSEPKKNRKVFATKTIDNNKTKEKTMDEPITKEELKSILTEMLTDVFGKMEEMKDDIEAIKSSKGKKCEYDLDPATNKSEDDEDDDADTNTLLDERVNDRQALYERLKNRNASNSIKPGVINPNEDIHWGYAKEIASKSFASHKIKIVPKA